MPLFRFDIEKIKEEENARANKSDTYNPSILEWYKVVNVELAAIGPSGVVVGADPGTGSNIAGRASLDILTVAL